MRRARPLLLVFCLVLSCCAGEPEVALDGAASTSPDDLQVQLAAQSTIDRIPPTQGNRITLLRDGSQAFPAMFAAMATAKDSINLEYYTFDDVRSGTQTLGEVLVDRLQHGVAVSVIYDAYGSKATPTGFLDRLRQAGATLTVFNANPLANGKLTSPNDRDHRKIMVIDGQIAFVGGINLDHVYENAVRSTANLDDAEHAYWRDTEARIDGPAVAELQHDFFATWANQGGVALPPRDWYPPLPAKGEQIVRILASAPNDDRPLYYVRLLQAVRAARHSISLSTGYFVPTHQEREELERAARRGVHVRLLLPSHSDSIDAMDAGHAAYDDLLKAGVRIYEVQDAVLHSKFIVIDGVWLAIGSSNFDRRSVVFNNEVDALVFGTAALAADKMFDDDVARAREIDLAAWRDRPVGERWNEFRVRFWEFLL